MMLAIDSVVNWNTFSRLAVHVGFLVDKVARGQVSLRVLWFSVLTIIFYRFIHHHPCLDAAGGSVGK